MLLKLKQGTKFFTKECVEFKERGSPVLENFSDWKEYKDASEGSGRSDKIWLVNSCSGQIGLFKYTKDNQTTEHISEEIAYKLASSIGLKSAECKVGIYKGRPGSMSYRINSPTQVISEGIHYISNKYPDFDSERLYDESANEYYSLGMVINSINEYNLVNDFIKIIIFDFLIGNSDRHQSNWATICEDATRNTAIRMCPIYDNGSSLCSYVKDETAPDILKDDLRFEALTNSKSKSRVRIDGHSKKQPTHLEVLRHVKANFDNEEISSFVNTIISVLTDEFVETMVSQYVKCNLLTLDKGKIITKFLLRKIQLLKSVFWGKEERQ